MIWVVRFITRNLNNLQVVSLRFPVCSCRFWTIYLPSVCISCLNTATSYFGKLSTGLAEGRSFDLGFYQDLSKLVHYSRLKTQDSGLTTQDSPLRTHHSPLTTHHSPLTTHHSLTTNDHRLKTTNYRLSYPDYIFVFN